MATDPAFNSNLMDDDQLKDWILREMGAPMIKIELTKESLCMAIENAKRWFAAKKGVVRTGALSVIDGVTEYPLQDDVDTVLDVSFSVSPLDLSLVFSPFMFKDEAVPYDVLASASGGGLYSSFVQSLQYIQTAKRILGADPDWRQENRKLFIFPLPHNASTIILEYKTKVYDIQELNERDHDLVKRYALASAQTIVARVQSKYDSFPTAQGSAMLNGLSLLDNARADIEKLNEEIGDSGMPMMFFTA